MNTAVKTIAKRVVPASLQPGLRAGYRAVYERVLFRQFKYRCPCCRSRLRHLLPHGFDFPVLKEKRVVGAGFRRHVRCPMCGSFDRERLLYLYLQHKTDIFAGPRRVLHVAPEARLEKLLRGRSTVDYLSADICPGNVMVQMDITDIQYPDNTFDAIICNHVLEHIVDDAKAMSELYRTLKPGGWAILQVPISLTLKDTYEDFSITDEKDREQAFGQADHVRIYGQDYRERLERAGFKVKVFNWTDEPAKFGGRRNVYVLNEEEAIYCAVKEP